MELTFKMRLTQQPGIVHESIFTDLDFERWMNLLDGKCMARTNVASASMEWNQICS